MDIELRPLRLAEILDRIFQLYRARFALFLGIAGVSTILELLWNLINMAEAPLDDQAPSCPAMGHHRLHDPGLGNFVCRRCSLPGGNQPCGGSDLRWRADKHRQSIRRLAPRLAAVRLGKYAGIFHSLGLHHRGGALGCHGNADRQARQHTWASQCDHTWCTARPACWSCSRCRCVYG